MDLGNMVQKKSTDDPKQPPKATKPEAGKKVLKPKKPEVGKKVARKTDEPRVDWVQRFRDYLREVSFELRKVVWPSRKETIGTTSVVLILVLLSGIFLGVVDLILSRLVRLIVG